MMGMQRSGSQRREQQVNLIHQEHENLSSGRRAVCVSATLLPMVIKSSMLVINALQSSGPVTAAAGLRAGMGPIFTC